MFSLISAPGGGEWLLIFAVIILIPVLAYRAGFRNGKREGERLQLQKQVDTFKKSNV